jgi:hypothetical protein
MTWGQPPWAVIGLEDLNQLRLWMESKPDVPEGRGTRNLARSSFVAKADALGRSFCRGNRPGGKSFDPPPIRSRNRAGPAYSRMETKHEASGTSGHCRIKTRRASLRLYFDRRGSVAGLRCFRHGQTRDHPLRRTIQCRGGWRQE